MKILRCSLWNVASGKWTHAVLEDDVNAGNYMGQEGTFVSTYSVFWKKHYASEKGVRNSFVHVSEKIAPEVIWVGGVPIILNMGAEKGKYIVEFLFLQLR